MSDQFRDGDGNKPDNDRHVIRCDECENTAIVFVSRSQRQLDALEQHHERHPERPQRDQQVHCYCGIDARRTVMDQVGPEAYECPDCGRRLLDTTRREGIRCRCPGGGATAVRFVRSSQPFSPLTPDDF